MPAEGGRLVRAAGGALWRPADGGGLQTALVHRPKYDDWSLPKGKPDEGEHLLETAVREVAEETGLEVVVGRRSVRTEYEVAEGPKRVDYWLMRVVGGEFAPNDEVDELRWLPVEEACSLVSHAHDRAVLADLARADVPREPSLLLVRHAKAGSKSDWDGPDELRPLDARGRRQAARLAAVLPLFRPVELLSAERVRCRETLEPLADRLGRGIDPLPPLGEEEFAADPQAALGAVERLLGPRGEPGVAVVCSQGGAIPSVLAALGVRFAGVPGALHPPAAKGSTWVLGGRPGALSADYYRDFSADSAEEPAVTGLR
ncbi:NUDIX hydrolase [Geodermatophilus poikilotrophus]|uniref:8-oxo-dGTP diphosphatase n=1 Tax=Geodermatophilus poikilotrophus TaxID=1333667 RepID=A0A1I0G0D3_9ACTN|nr:NUDIX hydrolase [Geodermatophilus poikilotrophus]SET64313.1 8-oxo-dGTP diphosphatase [Geodermatophilus poikilotrophus]